MNRRTFFMTMFAGPFAWGLSCSPAIASAPRTIRERRGWITVEPPVDGSDETMIDVTIYGQGDKPRTKCFLVQNGSTISVCDDEQVVLRVRNDRGSYPRFARIDLE